MRLAPPDAKLNRLVKGVITGAQFTPKVCLIDYDHQIREVVDAPEIQRGGVRSLVDRLRAQGDLMAIVHFGYRVIAPNWYETAIYYVPTGKTYTLSHITDYHWIAATDDSHPIWKSFEMEEGEENSP